MTLCDCHVYVDLRGFLNNFQIRQTVRGRITFLPEVGAVDRYGIADTGLSKAPAVVMKIDWTFPPIVWFRRFRIRRQKSLRELPQRHHVHGKDREWW